MRTRTRHTHAPPSGTFENRAEDLQCALCSANSPRRESIVDLLQDMITDGSLAEQARQGNVTYQRVLAECYVKGAFGLSTNYERAFHWYKIAADANDGQSL